MMKRVCQQGIKNNTKIWVIKVTKKDLLTNLTLKPLVISGVANRIKIQDLSLFLVISKNFLVVNKRKLIDPFEEMMLS